MASWPEPTTSMAYPCRSRPFLSRRAIFSESSAIRIRIRRHSSLARPPGRGYRPHRGRDRAGGTPARSARDRGVPAPQALAVHADQRGDFQGSMDRLLLDDTEARGVDLLVDHVRLEQRELKRCDHVAHHLERELDGASPVDDPCGIFCLPCQELLAVGVGDMRAGLHDDPWLTVVDPGQPGSGVVDMPTGKSGGPLPPIP